MIPVNIPAGAARVDLTIVRNPEEVIVSVRYDCVTIGPRTVQHHTCPVSRLDLTAARLDFLEQLVDRAVDDVTTTGGQDPEDVDRFLRAVDELAVTILEPLRRVIGADSAEQSRPSSSTPRSRP